MALFERISEIEAADISLWMEEVRHRINIKAHQQSNFFSFDFYSDAPFKISTNFIWENYPETCKPIRRSSVARSSYSTLTTSEFTGEIPNIFEKDVHFVVTNKA